MVPIKRRKERLSDHYRATKEEQNAATLPAYKALATNILLWWAKALYYHRRHTTTGRPIPVEFRQDQRKNLEEFPGSPACELYEKLSDFDCWVLYKMVCEYLETHENLQKHKASKDIGRTK